ncbi:hypothetical protein [Rhizohabitans arisaemae]|uniref:hypothetical protein n=1 Tax=Rhizohabitans arisaemae TaxID=2720610 RepID=UPI0024B0BB17|nr:hypothetical protein [Rhizohabitans arisaemae]
MLKRWRFAVPVALALGVLTGCGTEAENKAGGSVATSPSNSPAALADKRREIAAKKADCMKQKGFKYTAYVPKSAPEAVVKARLGDYAAMKEHRAKYGFDVFAATVYGQISPGEYDPNDNPNAMIIVEMSETQGEAFRKASGDCQVQAVNAVLGTNFRSNDEIGDESDRARERGERALDADPDLVRLAPGYADCLKAKGYRIRDTKPTKIATALFDLFSEKSRALLNEKMGDKGFTADALPTAEEAKPHLAREIKAALEDLECGKEFHAIYAPKNARILAEYDGVGSYDPT